MFNHNFALFLIGAGFGFIGAMFIFKRGILHQLGDK